MFVCILNDKFFFDTDTALKFMFSKKATKSYKIFTVETLKYKRQIDGRDFVIFWGLLRKHELYFYKTISG